MMTRRKLLQTSGPALVGAMALPSAFGGHSVLEPDLPAAETEDH